MSFGELTQAVGQSLVEAQTQLTEGVVEPPNRMALSDVTLELKIAIDGSSEGKIKVMPVSSEASRSGAVNVGALSTVTMRFAAFSEQPLGVSSPVEQPQSDRLLTEKEAIKLVADRTDLKNLARAFGPFTFDAVFVVAKTAWLVTAKGKGGETVREIILPATKA